MTERALPTVSVVIPTYNRRALLPRVLAPVLADDAAAETIVVVDGARDGSLELLRDVARDETRLKPVFVENAGEGAARRAGAERARGDVLLFLDDDVVARPGLVTHHALAQADRLRTVVVGYMPVEMSLPLERAERVATILYARSYEARCRLYEQDPAGILRSLWAGNFSIRRSDYARVPVAEDAFCTVGEDRAFGLRCRRAGLEAIFDRSLRADHLYRRTLAGFVREAHGRGRTAGAIRAIHRDAADTGSTRSRLGGALTPVVGSSRVRRAILPAAFAAASVAQAARLYPIEVGLARLLRRVAFEDGLDETTTALAPGE